VITGSRT